MVKRHVDFIENGKKRKTTYKKRKANILNKLTEITTLCGVEACAIIYSPYQEGPEIWPPSREAVNGVLRRLQNMPLTLQTQNALTQEDLVQKQIRKMREELREQERKNREEEIRAGMSHMLHYGPGLLYQMSLEDFNDTAWVLAEMEGQVEEALSKLGRGNDGRRENHQPSTGAATHPADDAAGGASEWET
uniref:MADS-box domain-containing protein n=1 Tax=Kalanchoe fedtschenkoi TaxID=63787 RepID=A0A7N1A0F8_KALFE